MTLYIRVFAKLNMNSLLQYQLVYAPYCGSLMIQFKEGSHILRTKFVV